METDSWKNKSKKPVFNSSIIVLDDIDLSSFIWVEDKSIKNCINHRS